MPSPNSRELTTGSPLAIAERWRKDRADDLDLDELRYIEASVSQRTEQEERYRTLYGRARAREWTHRAEWAQDPQLALLYALEVIKLSPDAQADRLVRACVHRVEADEIVEISHRGALEAAADRGRDTPHRRRSPNPRLSRHFSGSRRCGMRGRRRAPAGQPR